LAARQVSKGTDLTYSQAAAHESVQSGR